MAVDPGSSGTVPTGYLILNVTTGTVKRHAGSYVWETQIGGSASARIGFWGATPVVQPSGAGQAAVTLGNTDGEIGGLTISDPPTQAEVQALRDKAEELADDGRALQRPVDAARGACNGGVGPRQSRRLISLAYHGRSIPLHQVLFDPQCRQTWIFPLNIRKHVVGEEDSPTLRLVHGDRSWSDSHWRKTLPR